MPINGFSVDQFYDRNIFWSQTLSMCFYRNKFPFRFVCPHIVFLWWKILFNANTSFEKCFHRNVRDQQNIFDRNLLRLKRFSLEHVFGGNLFDRNTARSTHFRLNHFAIDDVKKNRELLKRCYFSTGRRFWHLSRPNQNGIDVYTKSNSKWVGIKQTSKLNAKSKSKLTKSESKSEMKMEMN